MNCATRITCCLTFLLATLVIPQALSTCTAQQKKAPASKIPRGTGQIPGPAVTPVKAGNRQQVRRAAANIDLLISTLHRANGVTPTNQLDDDLFCRRAFLQIAGRIPKLSEINRFLTSEDPQKREKLIDRLLSSHDYVSSMFNFWANLLRLQDHPVNNNLIAQPFHEWIKKSLAQNMPYDKWVREMLTAEGQVWDNPAVGYTLRDTGMDLDHVDNTVQVFLGTQIGCAQCHDHPFDRWTQLEFYRMASFTFGTQMRAPAGNKQRFPNGPPLQRLREEMKKRDPAYNTNGFFSRIINANLFEVDAPRRQRLKLPHDYAYDNGKPNQPVSPQPIFGKASAPKPGESQRDVMARWLTAPENPRFTRNIVNRLWKHAFGVGLIEPVDDLNDESKAASPELLAFLEQELKRLNYDTRELQRIIYNTSAWQRTATAEQIDPDQPWLFPAPILRRMTAEQIWDSLLTLAVYNFESFTRPSMQGVAADIDLELDKVGPAEVRKAAETFQQKYSTAAQNRITRQRNSYKGKLVLARASELPLPLPPGHFLRQFGQGDHELIDSASTDGNVAQILTMFNGEITHMMLEAGSVIYDNLLKARSVDQRIRVIFYSILGREPSRGDESTAATEIRRAGPAGYGNVIWALINTKEFLFIQ